MNQLPKHLLEFVNQATSWSDWENAKERLFKISEWKLISNEQLDKELSRSPFEISGIEWLPFSYPYDVVADIIDDYEQTGRALFAKFDPEGAAENRAHPERYGSKCNYCKVWARNPISDECPICGRMLLVLPLNEDED